MTLVPPTESQQPSRTEGKRDFFFFNFSLPLYQSYKTNAFMVFREDKPRWGEWGGIDEEEESQLV